MRKLFSFILFYFFVYYGLLSQAITPCSDCDTIQGRDRNYYYCDWYDSCYEYYHPYIDPQMSLELQFLHTPIYCNGVLYAKEMYTSHPIQIRGMMAMVDIYAGYNTFMNPTKLPEYLYLYQKGPNDSMILLDSTRWDTVNPHYMQLRVAADTDLFVYCYAYDTYFDSPITVDSFFFIGGSTNSNIGYNHTYQYIPTIYRTVDLPGCHPLYRGKTYEYFGSNGYWFTYEGVTGYYLPIVDNFEVTVSSTDIQRGTAQGGGFFMDGDTVTIRALPALGYIFNYWDDGNTDNPRQIVISQDTAFSAVFGFAASFLVSTSENNPAWGSVTGGGQHFEGETVSLTATPSLVSVMFDHWNDGNTDNPRLFTLTQDTSFTAFFRERELYSVSVLANNTAWGSVSGSGNYYEGDDVTMQAVPANSHCLFMSWDDSVTTNPRTFTATQDTSSTAIFREKELFTLTATPNNHDWGTVTGGGTYYDGTYVVMHASPANEYCSFIGWHDGNTYNPRAVTVDRDTSFLAIFSEIPLYTVSVTSNNPARGDVIGGGQYREGMTATLRAYPTDNDCFFIGWNDGNTDNPRLVTVTGDTSFVAIFSEIPLYTISVASNNLAWGDAIGGGQYREGTTATLRAYPTNEHHLFIRWDDDNTDNPRIITVLQDSAFTAIFSTKEDIASPEGEALNVTLSPSPACGQVTVHSSLFMTGVTIYDILGESVLEQTLEGYSVTLDIGTLSPGMYIVMIHTPRGSVNRKLVVN